MHVGMHGGQLGAVPVAALRDDQTVGDVEEPAAAEAVRIGPLQGAPVAVDQQADRLAGQRAAGEGLAKEVGERVPALRGP